MACLICNAATIGRRWETVVRIVPNHVCVVVNMVDTLIAVRGDEIVGELPVAARGKIT